MKSYIDKNHPLLPILHKYKKDFPIDSVPPEQAEKVLRGKEYIITGKIDGEIALIHYSRKRNSCILLSKAGRVRTELPVTYELLSLLESNKINELIAVGELYVEESPGHVMMYPKAISILRAPKSEKDLEKIKLMIFDIISVDGKNYLDKSPFERINFIKELFGKGQYYETVTVFDTKDFRRAWNKVLREKERWEGLVIVFKDGTRIKVKPTITVDLAVVGVEVSKSDPNKMGALLLAYMNDEGIFLFDSKVGTGFTDKEREEWLKWAEENEVSRKGRIIYVNPFNDPKIVEVEAREVHIEEKPGMKFDKKKEEWIFVDTYPVGTLRQPSFKRIREDKRLVPEDLRITQVIPASELKKYSFGNVTPIVSYRYSFVVDKDKDKATKLVSLLGGTLTEVPPYYVVSVDIGNDYIGFKPGDKVVSITKGIKGVIVDFEQIWCPNCNVLTLPIPRVNYPMFSVFYVCPECGYYLERTDVDYLVKWEQPIDEGYLYLSEVHPTEIKRISSKEDEIVLKTDYVTLTKQQIIDYYNSVKDKMPKNVKAFVIIMTDRGPIIRRNLKENSPIILTDETFDRLNHGRTIEFHKVIDSKLIDYFFVDIDPREKVPFNQVKKLTKDLYEYLERWDKVKDLAIQFSGNRGFYILGKLTHKMNVDDLRTTLVNILEDFIDQYGYKNVTTGITHNPQMVRLDVSTLKYNGSIKMPYSLSYKTGLVSVPIDDIDQFEKEDAKPFFFIKRSFKNLDYHKLIGYEGRFSIQEHYTYSRDRTHFDLRLEVPIDVVKS